MKSLIELMIDFIIELFTLGQVGIQLVMVGGGDYGTHVQALIEGSLGSMTL